MKGKGKIVLSVWVFLALLCFTCQGYALEYTLGGNPLNITGFIQQSVNYGYNGDSHYESKGRFNSFLTQALLEVGYQASDTVRLFTSGSFNGDWAYSILSSSSQWDRKNFDRSRDRLFILDDWQDVLKEAHLTWVNDKFYVRAGKQIVQWGETDGFLLTNLINPIDQRRGLGDVKFENNVLPIWLLRTEYNTPVQSTWLKEIGLQFVFDPNFQFRGNDVILPGNDYQGVWTPKVTFPIGGPYPFDYGYVGSLNVNYQKLHDFDPKGFTYGLKVKSNIMDAIVNLLFYYGRDRDVVMTDNPSLLRIEPTNTWDRRMVLHPGSDAYYPYFKFIGATVTKDLSGLKSSALGGVSPVLRLEALYAFNSSYTLKNNITNSMAQVAKTDEFRGMIGFDWKVKIPFLNPTSYFLISPQYFYQKMMDYPHGNVSLVQRGSVGGRFEVANHKTTLMVNTNYFHTKVTPMIFWLRDWTNRTNMYKAQVSYEPTSNWIYTIGALAVYGKVEGWGMEAMENKDQVFLTVGYRF